MITVSEVSKKYGSAVVVDGVSLTLTEGGITSIIGANGAGKSTLLGLISRLTAPDGGSITIDGLDVHATKSDVLAKKLAILKQDTHMSARLTVRDLVSFGRYPYSKGRLTADDRQHIDQALTYLDLNHLADRFVDELSGGQRQRAHIAMVFAQDTEYVLLDEPLNNLDMKHSVATMRMLRTAARDLGKRIVIVLHDINFAARYSDVVVGMRDGKLVCHGPVEEIVTPEVLSELYDMPIDVRSIDGQRVCLYFD